MGRPSGFTQGSEFLATPRPPTWLDDNTIYLGQKSKRTKSVLAIIEFYLFFSATFVGTRRRRQKQHIFERFL